MFRRHVLFVDDDQQTLKTVSFMLEQAGYVVKQAEDGFAGIELARRLAFDLVILDINMPHLDGYTILETFQNIPEMENVPIMILTGRDDVKSVKKAREKGAIDYVIKPVQKEQLLDRVVAILGTRPQFKEIKMDPGRDSIRGLINYNAEIKSISETGMVFHSEVPLPVGLRFANFSFDLFRQLGIQVPKLRIVDCVDHRGTYHIYASFVEMPEKDIPKIRQWVIERSYER